MNAKHRYKASSQFKNAFNLDWNVVWKGIGSNGATGTYAGIFPKHIGKEFGITVNYLGLILEIMSTIDQSQCLDKPLDFVQ